MCCIPQNSGRIIVMHSQWINIGGYNWTGFGLVFVTNWARKNNNLATLRPSWNLETTKELGQLADQQKSRLTAR